LNKFKLEPNKNLTEFKLDVILKFLTSKINKYKTKQQQNRKMHNKNYPFSFLILTLSSGYSIEVAFFFFPFFVGIVFKTFKIKRKNIKNFLN
jgi:hypothetical protein